MALGGAEKLGSLLLTMHEERQRDLWRLSGRLWAVALCIDKRVVSRNLRPN